MAKTRVPEIDRLFDEVLEYRNTTEFEELRDFVVKLRHVAPYNAMLIHIQKPGSEFFASAADWHYNFNRTVKPGARPLLILKPFGPVSFVFEYNDTYGDPLPDDLVKPFKNDAPVKEYQLSLLKEGAGHDGIDVGLEDYGTNQAGCIGLAENAKLLRFDHPKVVYYIHSQYRIALNKNMELPEQFTTMLHELGHFYCGHINYGNMSWLPERAYLGKNEKEFEAETVCWLVCRRFGIDSCSVDYLAGYKEKNNTIPNVSVDSILRSAGIIENILSGIINPRKELIRKKEPKE